MYRVHVNLCEHKERDSHQYQIHLKANFPKAQRNLLEFLIAVHDQVTIMPLPRNLHTLSLDLPPNLNFLHVVQIILLGCEEFHSQYPHRQQVYFFLQKQNLQYHAVLLYHQMVIYPKYFQ